MNLDFNKKISIGIIWLFHLSGLVGLLYIDKNLFASLTPLNLFISSTLLFVNQKSLKKKEVIIVFLIFSIGMIAEILGVNYGLIFGKYDYGDNLGLKLLGVPLLIGLNWVVLTFICGSISNHFIKNKYLSIVVGIIFMLIIDITLEPIAPTLDYWEFSGSIAPIQNYIGWAFTSLLTLYIYQFYYSSKEFTFSINLFLAQFLFFVGFNFLG
ncbi:MAG: carotenoid biosynthesis protein [Flavobacteriales bacterium]|nr:MAG: carotenoid biosynthesis protein [Flavobacteriales bacterium]